MKAVSPGGESYKVWVRQLLQEKPAAAADLNMELLDLGLMEYNRAHEFQLYCVEQRLRGKRGDVFLFTEHPPVFTLGRQGRVDSLLKSRQDIQAQGVAIVPTERGGDITYHGPGQLVVYPILNLRHRKLVVAKFVDLLEETMIRTARDCKVHAVRDTRNRGIWVGNNKIGSIGIRVRHGVTFHGLALNVNLSLEPFTWIQPCGLKGVGVTSLKKECGREVNMEKVKQSMHTHIRTLFACETE